MADISFIIVSYNTALVTKRCVDYLYKALNRQKLNFEIIVVDNHSSDQTVKILKKYLSDNNFKLIINKKNLGFAKANNQAVKQATGKNLLFLNSDVMIMDVDFPRLIKFLDEDKQLGGLTVRVELENGKLDQACHRGFPTVWRAFCYYSGLEKLLRPIPLINRVFGGYHLVGLDLSTVHEIDSPSGAFYLVKRRVFDQINGFDEQFFMYGEDLDLSYRIKNQGYKIKYYPQYRVIHLKYQSGIANKNLMIKLKTKTYFYQAMIIFYKKHYWHQYPRLVNQFVLWLIKKKSGLNEKQLERIT